MIDVMKIFRTGFYTSLFSFTVFSFLDYFREGFVSNVFSVNWFLFFILLFAIGWSVFYRETKQSLILKLFGSVFIALLLFIVIWYAGGYFAEYRVVVALSGASSFWIVSKLLNEL